MESSLLRVISNHRPLADINGTYFCVCGAPWPDKCKSFQKSLTAASNGVISKMRAYMLVHYLKALTHPQFRDVAPREVHERFLGWIDSMAEAQRRVDEAQAYARQAAERALRTSTTGAQRALNVVARATLSAKEKFASALNRGPSRSTPPARGVVRYGEVRDKAVR